MLHLHRSTLSCGCSWPQGSTTARSSISKTFRENRRSSARRSSGIFRSTSCRRPIFSTHFTPGRCSKGSPKAPLNPHPKAPRGSEWDDAPHHHPGIRSTASQHCRTTALPRPSTQRRLLYMDANLANRITVDPGKRSGKPCIRGLRITVSDVLEYLASGMTEPQILADFPELTIEDIRACLAFAAERERRLLGSVA